MNKGMIELLSVLIMQAKEKIRNLEELIDVLERERKKKQDDTSDGAAKAE